MNIAFFSTKYPYEFEYGKYTCGGSILASKSLVTELSKLNNNFRIFSTSINSQYEFTDMEKIKIHRYGTNFRFLSTNISFKLFYKSLKYNEDLTHISFDIPPGPLAGYIYSKKKRLPLIITYHGDWEDSYGHIIRRMGVKIHNKFLVDKMLNYADAIISPSDIFINNSKFLSKYKNKTVVIPNGVDINEFNIDLSVEECRKILNLPLDDHVILFLGNLSPYKGPDVLLKAFKLVLEKNPKSTLIFGGSGEMCDYLKKLSLKLGVEKKVKFIGYVRKKNRSFYYRAADIFCLPSTMNTESFGIVNLESMASGTPIIATNCGGIPEIVKDGENGFLVPPNDHELLANNISYLLENRDIRAKMGKTGKIMVKNFSWEKIALKTDKLYKKIMIK